MVTVLIAFGWFVASLGGEHWRNRRHLGRDQTAIAADVTQ
jgi:hypothetical protein